MRHETGDAGSEVPVISTLLCKQWDLQRGLGGTEPAEHHTAGRQGKASWSYTMASSLPQPHVYLTGKTSARIWPCS